MEDWWWWIVRDPGSGEVTCVAASSEEEALDLGADELGIDDEDYDAFYAEARLVALPWGMADELGLEDDS